MAWLEKIGEFLTYQEGISRASKRSKKLGKYGFRIFE